MCSWLENLLCNVSHQVRVRQETEKRMKRVLDRMEELESSQDRIFEELSERQLGVIKEIIDKLVSYFKSPETSKRFCEWSVAQVPDAGEKWEETKSKVLKCISERAQKCRKGKIGKMILPKARTRSLSIVLKSMISWKRTSKKWKKLLFVTKLSKKVQRVSPLGHQDLERSRPKRP